MASPCDLLTPSARTLTWERRSGMWFRKNWQNQPAKPTTRLFSLEPGMTRRILVTGATGFIGRELCKALLAQGYSLTVLSRQDPEAVTAMCGPVEPVNRLDLLEAHSGFDAVFNLAGEGIADKRWSAARKAALDRKSTRLNSSHVKSSYAVFC